MARGYVTGVALDQLELVPVSPRDRLPEDHLAWFIDDVVAAVDTSSFHAERRTGGRGRAGYDPDRLLAVLLYAYAHGVQSSRRIEALCQVDAAFQVLLRGVCPDHTTLARFRSAHVGAFKGLFVQVLALCAAEGMARLGVVALDGTKMTANASLRANHTEAVLRQQVDRLVDEAEAIDAAEDDLFGDARGDELPQGLADRRGRVERLKHCLADIEASHEPPGVEWAEQRVAKAEATLTREQAKRERFMADRRVREAEASAAGKQIPGPAVVAEPPKVRRARQQLERAKTDLAAARTQLRRTDAGAPVRRNVTDPDSRVMKAHGRWVQGYNSQAVVSEDGVILAADVVNNPSDATVFLPMVDLLAESLQAAGIDDEPAVVVADAGYWSKDNAVRPGPNRLIATNGGERSPTDPERYRCPARQAMTERLAEPDNVAAYRKRQATVEPAFGRIKAARGLRGFVLRGLDRVKGEWDLICLTENLLAIHRRARLA